MALLPLASVLLAGVVPARRGRHAAICWRFLSAGGDTISVERFTRTAQRLEGELLISSANARFTYAIDVDAEGGATRLVNEYRQASRRSHQ